MSSNAHKILLHDVLYVPDAQDNLLSISRVDHIGGQVKFGNGRALLIDKNKQTVAEGKLNNWLYVLSFFRKAEPSKQANITRPAQNGWNEWHKRFGHVGISGLRRLKQTNLVSGFNVDTDSPFIECEPCIAAKQAHTPFPEHAEPRNTIPGELTHTDVWGPSSIQALNGARYNVVIVDDNSRHLTSKQIKTKADTSIRLQNYLTYIEQQFGFKPKSVWFDQGKEFLNKKFIEWCADKGIKIETTAPYSPSQNGVAERFNRTIVELARAMIIARDVPKNLWHEAINYATYVRDKSFTRAIKGKTPDEGFTGQKPDVSHLQEFGSPVWVLNESRKSKLDPKSQKMLFMRFLEGPHAIKYYNARTRHIGTTQNYYFATAPPDTQFEEEEELMDQPMGDQIESEERNENIKRKCPDDDPPNERN